MKRFSSIPTSQLGRVQGGSQKPSNPDAWLTTREVMDQLASSSR